MPIPRDVTQDADPVPEPDDSHRALPRRPAEKPAAPPEKKTAHAPSDPGDEHIGATEDQVSPTTPPAGKAYEDEPKQG